MNAGKLWKYNYAAGVAFIIIALAVYKFRFLSLPYYWDEAWPYSVGVHDLYDNGLSLMPGAISSFVARGHPLMFHFLAAGWMKIFGTGLFSGHSFALFISVCLIITIYIFCKTFFSERIGLIACIIYSCQPLFITQSVFLMPEVLMGLWTMLSFLFFFRKKKILFIFCGTAMLLTKESGGVFFVALFLYECAALVAAKEKNYKASLRTLALISTPVLIGSVNFIIQKIKFGWFLYPFHMDYLSSSKPFTENIATVLAYSFIYDGRNGFSFFIIISLFVLFISRKIKFTENEKHILPAFAVFIVLYVIFSTVNYYIPRYLVCLFPPFYIIGAVLIDKVFSRVKTVLSLIVLGLVITSIFYYTQPKKYGDIDYSPSIITDQQMVRFCEDQHLYDKYIMIRGLLTIDLAEPYAGYRSAEQKFTHVEWGFSDKTEYCIFSVDENNDAVLAQLKKEYKLELVKRFEKKYAWCEIYRVVRQ